MIRSFACADTEALFHSQPVARFKNIERVVRRKLLQLSGELPKRFTPTQLKHATYVQLGDAFSAGLSVWGLKRSDNYKQAKTFAIGLYEEAE